MRLIRQWWAGEAWWQPKGTQMADLGPVLGMAAIGLIAWLAGDPTTDMIAYPCDPQWYWWFWIC